MIRRQFIQPQDLRSWWDWIKPGLEKIRDKSPEYWISEDVYAECYFGKAMLWVFLENNHPFGFVVLQPKPETLHIWCAWTEAAEFTDTCFEQVKEIAKTGNAKRVTFDSWRKGWEKRARQLNFKPRSWVMEI
jgi:hypothetical protein